MNDNIDKVLTKRNIILIGIALVIMIVFLVVFSDGSLKNTKKAKKNQEAEIKLVTSASRFYTVAGCVNKYLLYLKDQDSQKLYTVLTPSYINEQKITAENVLNKIPLLPDDGDYSFNPRKMYQQQQTETIIKYYIFGYVEKNEFMSTTTSNPQPAYYIVTLDNAHLTFSIMPYDGKVFQ